jgi:uncharacterized membrane-anchored protein YhcB (DUF1043 family)
VQRYWIPAAIAVVVVVVIGLLLFRFCFSSVVSSKAVIVGIETHDFDIAKGNGDDFAKNVNKREEENFEGPHELAQYSLVDVQL